MTLGYEPSTFAWEEDIPTCNSCGRPALADLCTDCIAAGVPAVNGAKPKQNGNIPNEDGSPLLVTATQFIAEREEEQIPLWGNELVSIIPLGGLAILAGRPGAGKTTFVLDLACHLASGQAYPPVDKDNPRAPTPWPVNRPLRIALIENEGPREMFRGKIAEKIEAFDGDVADNIFIQTWRWGAFSFADKDAHARAYYELDENQIDIVIGDPLSTLGPAGVGSPEDTRNFVTSLRPLGLGVTRAFLFLHHFRERVERQQDELARISGAWGGHLDTLITLSAMNKADHVRLAYPKLRWARGKPPDPIVLGRIYATAAFEALAEENDATMLEPIVYAQLAETKAQKGGRKGEGWSTTTEIAKAIESRRVDVKKTLEGAPHMFFSLTGQDAKALGARASAVLWGLTEWIAGVDTEVVEP